MSLIRPGTVMQGFLSLLFSLGFVVLHARLWVYPSWSANLLKLFTDTQVFLVAAIGLCLQIDDDGSLDPGLIISVCHFFDTGTSDLRNTDPNSSRTSTGAATYVGTATDEESTERWAYRPRAYPSSALRC